MKPTDAAPVSREEFEEFLHFFTHEVRNRLNAIGLEAADLAEQMDDSAKAMRLQMQVRECAAFLKAAREILSPDDPEAEHATLTAAIARLRSQKL
jgi:signal transduction histidine kinase